jgi:16S rRNA processing protein RimM
LSSARGAGADIGAGRVGRPHGLDGSFYVTRARPRLLALGTTVTVAGEHRRIVRRAGTEQRPIVQLEGVADRDAALALRGAELSVPGARAPALGEDEYWAHELEGCDVRSTQGEHVGVVTRLIELPSCEALEVRRDGGGAELLVPMVRDAVRSVDVAARAIEVDVEFLDLEPGAGSRAGAREQGTQESEPES